ncbi:hypothetical protein N3K66_005395 [Trichothecium roseum]|uniref:Uncharacterized protein n=1 Tax=Trichothecium roseum TaxID=47278 RepID=A0ACC0UXT0_9HYPO|nr:hypothetical protein N3K66_005395 [Trichothecium roseum]
MDKPHPHSLILTRPSDPQGQCRLLTVPYEIRYKIYRYALSDFPDPAPEKQYGRDESYTRPRYFSPRLTDTRLLQTCRAIYREAWTLPFTLKTHTHWICHRALAPPTCIPADDFIRPDKPSTVYLAKRISDQQKTDGYVLDKKGVVDVESTQIFAQVHMLQEGDVAYALRHTILRPRQITLTIRRDDWAVWNPQLHLPGAWIGPVCEVLPDSVRRINVEVEQDMLRKEAVDAIIDQMRDKWFFKRKDGTRFYADASRDADDVTVWPLPPPTPVELATWTEFMGPNGLDLRAFDKNFYNVSVTFTPRSELEVASGVVSANAKRAASAVVPQGGWQSLDLLSPEPMQPIMSASLPLLQEQLLEQQQ